MLIFRPQTPPRKGFSPWWAAGLATLALALASSAAWAADPAADPAAGEKAAEAPKEPETLTLRTSDGVEIAASFYPIADDADPLATVILLHDLGGSRETVAPLAKALQAGGCSVVVPDLRGHGKSPIPELTRAAGDGDQAALLKTVHFLAMTATAGGRVREQASIRGDIEATFQWIQKNQSSRSSLNVDKLYLVGSGLGASLAAGWTVNDAAWPPIATGAQGGKVCGLVMVDPALVTRGLSIGKLLATEPIKTGIPIMIIAGGNDRDSAKVFDQLKRMRPSGWFDSRLFDAETRRNTSPAKDTTASLMFLKLGGRLERDKLASARSTNPRQQDPAGLILAFIQTAAERR
jgi:pimeloyl-ACP methyl ester carboxylesterase